MKTTAGALPLGSDQAFGAAILTWRNYESSARCLHALTESSEWPFPVLVVDNNSGTSEGARLAADFGGTVTSIELPFNGGVAAGYNAALEWAAREELAQVLLLNNDVLVRGDSISQLRAAISHDVAAINPVVRSNDGQVLFSGGTLSPWLNVTRRLTDVPMSIRSTDWVEGSCVLVSTRAACEIGGLALDYFLYIEDVDWSVRARGRGFKLLLEPRASVHHSESSTATIRQKRFYSLRNSLLFARRNLSLLQNATALASWVMVRAPVYLVRMGPIVGVRAAASDVLHALTWNLADARTNRSWRRSSAGPKICQPGK